KFVSPMRFEDHHGASVDGSAVDRGAGAPLRPVSSAPNCRPQCRVERWRLRYGVIVAVVLCAGTPPLQLLDTSTQNCVVEFTGSVVKNAEFVPTGVVFVPDGPWYH